MGRRAQLRIPKSCVELRVTAFGIGLVTMNVNVLTIFGQKQQKRFLKGSSCVVITFTFLLQVVSVGLALGAMSRASKATLGLTLEDVYCQYSSDGATGLAAGAAVSLLFAQAIIMGVTGCLSCGLGPYKGGSRASLITVAFWLAWLFFLIAEFYLIAGAVTNKLHTKTHVKSLHASTLTCQEVQEWVFAAGAGFTFLTLLLDEIYYLALVKASKASDVLLD